MWNPAPRLSPGTLGPGSLGCAADYRHRSSAHAKRPSRFLASFSRVRRRYTAVRAPPFGSAVNEEASGHEAHLSAEQPQTKEDARVPHPHANQKRQAAPRSPKSEGTGTHLCLTPALSPSRRPSSGCVALRRCAGPSAQARDPPGGWWYCTVRLAQAFERRSSAGAAWVGLSHATGHGASCGKAGGSWPAG